MAGSGTPGTGLGAIHRHAFEGGPSRFEQAGGDWAAFYQRAAELGELPLVERERALAALAGSN